MAARDRPPPRIDPLFFEQDAVTVARSLLGHRLVRLLEGQRLSGTIIETEAYCPDGAADLACHASKNGGRPTARTQVMFGSAGHAYVYFNYGIHWLFNIVTGREGVPGAVLIRALDPLEGIGVMSCNRGRPENQLTDGPAKLTQALKIDGAHNGMNLCQPESVIWVEPSVAIPAKRIVEGPRVGLGKTPEPWLSMPWRYRVI